MLIVEQDQVRQCPFGDLERRIAVIDQQDFAAVRFERFAQKVAVRRNVVRDKYGGAVWFVGICHTENFFSEL